MNQATDVTRPLALNMADAWDDIMDELKQSGLTEPHLRRNLSMTVSGPGCFSNISVPGGGRFMPISYVTQACQQCGRVYAVVPSKARLRKYCSTHCAYRERTQPLAQRFWAKVQKGGEDQCWEWQASLSTNGYGKIGSSNNKTLVASRVSWELAYGQLPVGIFVLHRCDNPLCVNPSHLFLGTARDNIRDASSKGRHPSQMNPGCHSGTRNGRACFTEDDVRAIRALRGTMTYAQIAKLYNASVSRVSQLMRGATWKHVL